MREIEDNGRVSCLREIEAEHSNNNPHIFTFLITSTLTTETHYNLFFLSIIFLIFLIFCKP